MSLLYAQVVDNRKAMVSNHAQAQHACMRNYAVLQQVRWKVRTHTSDIMGAGTNAQVWVQLHGPTGLLSGSRIELDNSRDNFERNQVSKCGGADTAA